MLDLSMPVVSSGLGCSFLYGDGIQWIEIE